MWTEKNFVVFIWATFWIHDLSSALALALTALVLLTSLLHTESSDTEWHKILPETGAKGFKRDTMHTARLTICIQNPPRNPKQAV